MELVCFHLYSAFKVKISQNENSKYLVRNVNDKYTTLKKHVIRNYLPLRATRDAIIFKYIDKCAN